MLCQMLTCRKHGAFSSSGDGGGSLFAEQLVHFVGTRREDALKQD